MNLTHVNTHRTKPFYRMLFFLSFIFSIFSFFSTVLRLKPTALKQIHTHIEQKKKQVSPQDRDDALKCVKELEIRLITASFSIYIWNIHNFNVAHFQLWSHLSTEFPWIDFIWNCAWLHSENPHDIADKKNGIKSGNETQEIHMNGDVPAHQKQTNHIYKLPFALSLQKRFHSLLFPFSCPSIHLCSHSAMGTIHIVTYVLSNESAAEWTPDTGHEYLSIIMQIPSLSHQSPMAYRKRSPIRCLCQIIRKWFRSQLHKTKNKWFLFGS